MRHKKHQAGNAAVADDKNEDEKGHDLGSEVRPLGPGVHAKMHTGPVKHAPGWIDPLGIETAPGKVSDKIQAYDQRRHFNHGLYDMSLGEIACPSVPNPRPHAVAPAMNHQSTGLCVECGRGVAPGQNALCRDHVRFN